MLLYLSLVYNIVLFFQNFRTLCSVLTTINLHLQRGTSSPTFGQREEPSVVFGNVVQKGSETEVRLRL